MLPVGSLFSATALGYKTVLGHFRKWSKKGEWEQSWTAILSNYKDALDLSSRDIDGSHTTALHGGEQVAYQARKKGKRPMLCKKSR